eukprot:UN28666
MYFKFYVVFLAVSYISTAFSGLFNFPYILHTVEHNWSFIGISSYFNHSYIFNASLYLLAFDKRDIAILYIQSFTYFCSLAILTTRYILSKSFISLSCVDICRCCLVKLLESYSLFYFGPPWII